MKRHTQTTGVRKYFGGDLLELQSEPLKVLDSVLGGYGECVVSGVEITAEANSLYSLSAGIVALLVHDEESGKDSIKVMEFKGATGVTLPCYLTPQTNTITRTYANDKVEPIAYCYEAVVSGVKPSDKSNIELTSSAVTRFVDVIQDSTHRFITDAERATWNAAKATTVVQETGSSTTSVMSQNAVTEAIDSAKTTVVNATGSSTTSAISQSAATAAATAAKTTVVSAVGTSTTSAMSQYGVKNNFLGGLVAVIRLRTSGTIASYWINPIYKLHYTPIASTVTSGTASGRIRLNYLAWFDEALSTSNLTAIGNVRASSSTTTTHMDTSITEAYGDEYTCHFDVYWTARSGSSSSNLSGQGATIYILKSDIY